MSQGRPRQSPLTTLCNFFEAPEDSKLETPEEILSTASPTTAPLPKPATAEALASDEGPEFEEFRECLREHVPYWTLETE